MELKTKGTKNDFGIVDENGIGWNTKVGEEGGRIKMGGGMMKEKEVVELNV